MPPNIHTALNKASVTDNSVKLTSDERVGSCNNSVQNNICHQILTLRIF